MSKKRSRLSCRFGSLHSFVLRTISAFRTSVHISRMSATRSLAVDLVHSKQRLSPLGRAPSASSSRKSTGRRCSRSSACQKASLLCKHVVFAVQSPLRRTEWTTVTEAWRCRSLSIAFVAKGSAKTVSFFHSATPGMISQFQTRTLSRCIKTRCDITNSVIELSTRPRSGR